MTVSDANHGGNPGPLNSPPSQAGHRTHLTPWLHILANTFLFQHVIFLSSTRFHPKGVIHTSPGQRPGSHRVFVFAPCKGTTFHCVPPLQGGWFELPQSRGAAPGWYGVPFQGIWKDIKTHYPEILIPPTVLSVYQAQPSQGGAGVVAYMTLVTYNNS